MLKEIRRMISMDFQDSPQEDSQEDSQEESNHLFVPESIDTEVYSEGKEPDEVDNGNLIEQLSINSPPQVFWLVKDYVFIELDIDEYKSDTSNYSESDDNSENDDA
ncbi:7154_t:CDS:2, partial [Racocetra fulgida]